MSILTDSAASEKVSNHHAVGFDNGVDLLALAQLQSLGRGTSNNRGQLCLGADHERYFGTDLGKGNALNPGAQ